MPRPIRFYAGDEMKYCADKFSEAESGLKIPASFADKFAVDRSVILGGKAVLEAFANTGKHGGMPFFGLRRSLTTATVWKRSSVRYAVWRKRALPWMSAGCEGNYRLRCHGCGYGGYLHGGIR